MDGGQAANPSAEVKGQVGASALWSATVMGAEILVLNACGRRDASAQMMN